MHTAGRWLLYLVAAGVLVLVLLAVVARLLLPLVPRYQDDIRARVSEATGYDIESSRISASWQLAGPQLSFHDVRLSRDGEVLLAARELSAGLSILRLLRDWQPSLGRVTLRGAAIEVERRADGTWLFQRHALADLLPRRPPGSRPRMVVRLEDIDIGFRDFERTRQPLVLKLERLRARIDEDAFDAELRLRPPAGMGRTLALAISMPAVWPVTGGLPERLDLRLSGTALELPALIGLVTGGVPALGSATTDVVLQASVRAGILQQLEGDIGLRDVAIGTDGAGGRYQRITAHLRFARDDGGWQAAVEQLHVHRKGQNSPPAEIAVSRRAGDGAAAERWSVRTTFLRLDDLFPLVEAALRDSEFAHRLPRTLSGDLRDVEGEFAGGGAPAYWLRGSFERLTAMSANGDLAVRGLSGSVTADTSGGRVEIDSRDAGIGLAQWFSEELGASVLSGLFVWHSEPAGLRLQGDEVVLRTPGIDILSHLELRFPADGTSPLIDLQARATAGDARGVLRYLPLRRFPPSVTGWLERAIVAGRVPRAKAEFRGPLAAFPYEPGEGVFKVVFDLEDGVLDYADKWPRIEDLDAEVVFDGLGMYSVRNSGRIGKLRLGDFEVRIEDLRKGLLSLQGSTQSGLDTVFDFLRTTPVADTLGDTLRRVTAGGPVSAGLHLVLPIPQPHDYRLDMRFDVHDGRLGLQQVPVDLKKLRGHLELQNTRLSATGLQGVMLGAPVQVELRPGEAGAAISHVAVFSGSTPVTRVGATFSLPLREYFSGQLDWQAEVRVPAVQAGIPLSMTLRSDLNGVASTLPPPLAKSIGQAWPAVLELSFPKENVIDIAGHLQPPLAWAARLVAAKDGWRVARGALHAGGLEARLPAADGVALSGRVGDVWLSDWLALGDGKTGGRRLEEIYREASLQIGRLIVAGQVFPEVGLSVRREPAHWAIAVNSANAEGNITVPFGLDKEALQLDMRRLWLLESLSEGRGDPDPRHLPAAGIHIADAALGKRHLGRLDMTVVKTADGLEAPHIVSQGRSFRLEGEGAWRVAAAGSPGQSTSLRMELEGSDVADLLGELGFDPVLTGKKARLSSDLLWSGGPAADFLNRASGRISIGFESGQVLDIEPGSGRILGLLSVMALPRRLALDFRDVFNKGLAYDAIAGDFRVGAGSAYTCNLGLTGPAADIAIIGRTDFAHEDYDQLAVVRPQVSNVLTVGGAVLGGPVGGVTMLLISQLFRKPLGTLGESYYRVSGSWDKPEVLPTERSDVDAAAFKRCEREVTTALQAAGTALPGDATVDQVPKQQNHP